MCGCECVCLVYEGIYDLMSTSFYTSCTNFFINILSQCVLSQECHWVCLSVCFSFFFFFFLGGGQGAYHLHPLVLPWCGHKL